MNSVELFGGCGGLALGIEKAGFNHRIVVEKDAAAAGTMEFNRGKFGSRSSEFTVLCEDVGLVDWQPYRGAALVAGGPPCQPFSGGGIGAGNLDPRDKWPEALRAVREIRPSAFMFENVKGLMRPKFDDYRNSVTQAFRDLGYSVTVVLTDAADYGVAQRRHRVFFLGVGEDVGSAPVVPDGTHSCERLVWDKWVDGTYWPRVGMDGPDPITITAREKQILKRLERTGEKPTSAAWRTVREALLPLGEPNGENGHILKEGAKAYPGHTGSMLDLPSKAIKAGVHGVPGGENMFVRDGGGVRYYTVREAAAIQGFPVDYVFPGSWSAAMKQIGNAVPVRLAEVMAGAVVSALTSGSANDIAA